MSGLECQCTRPDVFDEPESLSYMQLSRCAVLDAVLVAQHWKMIRLHSKCGLMRHTSSHERFNHLSTQ